MKDYRRTYCRRCSQEGEHVRVYCPACGEVTCGMKRHGVWMGLPHYRSTRAEGTKLKKEKPCLGGTIDPETDRAP